MLIKGSDIMDKEQRKLLKKIKRRKLFSRSELLEGELQTFFYLQRNRFVAPKGIPNDKKQYFVITEEGKAELHTLHQSDFRFWFPILLSNLIAIAAIIISIIALLRTPAQ